MADQARHDKTLWDKRKQKTATWAVFKTVFISKLSLILATTYSSVAEAKVPSAIRGFPVWFGMEQRVTPAL